MINILFIGWRNSSFCSTSRGGIKGILLTSPGAEFVKISTTEDKVKYTKCGFKIVVDKIVHYLTLISFTGLLF